MKVLIFGAKGQLGREFCKYFDTHNLEYFAYDIDDCDISDFQLTKNKFENHKPDIVLNCSAYNLVDKAESDSMNAYYSNAIGPTHIALLSNQFNCKLIHYGTDYVFDGSKGDDYFENDVPNPLNIYGMSKLMGEKQVQQIANNYLILRLSWVYGIGSPNTFLSKLKQWSQNTNTLRIVDDEISVPTSVRTIVDVTMKAINEKLNGLYHLANSGKASRWEWAIALNEIANLNLNIVKAKSSEFNLPAKRPLVSAMSNQKISEILGIEIPNWKEELTNYYKF